MARYKQNLTDILGVDKFGQELRRGDYVVIVTKGELSIAIVNSLAVNNKNKNFLKFTFILCEYTLNHKEIDAKHVVIIPPDLATNHIVIKKLQGSQDIRKEGLRLINQLTRQRELEMRN